MAMTQTFSESWYRVAQQKISLRPQAQIQRQLFRGTEWYVIRDPFSNRFFRLRPEAYEFAARLRPTRTVEEVWEECLQLNPEGAPGQEEVIQLLAQLYHANLLHYDIPVDSAELFERYSLMKQRETTSRLLNIMFAHFPLFDPDPLIRRLLPIARIFISPFGLVIWLAAVIYALKLGVDNFSALRQQSEGVLDPGNLILLYVSLALLKTAHEFGHAFFCRRFGGEVHTIGIMLLVFTPLPYMDATSSWFFRSKWTRALVGAAGIIVELFVAACATVVWTRTAPGLLHSLAYNLIFIASVSTLLFNGNPLLRFDGYYILSDILDVPNLHQQCARHLTYLVEKYAFGVSGGHSPAETFGEACWLFFYGVVSRLYRIFVFVRILFFVADRFLLLGIIMFFVCVISWGITPLIRLVKYLAASPKLVRQRLRAIVVTGMAFAGVVVILYFIPYPDRFRAPGMISAEKKTDVITEAGGYAREILAASGQRVQAGQPLLVLDDERMAYEIAAAETRCRLTIAQIKKALEDEPADLVPLRDRLRVYQEQLEFLRHQQEQQIIRAPHDGIWVSPNLHELVGSIVDRGTTVGQLFDVEKFKFTAIVSQNNTSRLFGENIKATTVRVQGRAGTLIPTKILRIISAEQSILPSAVLGWLGGGSVEVDLRDPTGLRAVEPFFEVEMTLPEQDDLVFLHGRSGIVRFELAPRPLLLQWYRRVRQLLQKRYHL